MQAQVLSAAGHPIRLAIIDFLKDKPECVCDIAEFIGAKRSNVSRHLSVLQQAGIVSAKKQGLKMIYSLKTPCILNFLGCVSNILKARLAEQSKIISELD